MDDKIKITYLLNSGFILEMDKCAMIFDYYRDEQQLVPQIIKAKSEVYFFASHVHFDHFNPEITKFSDKATKYFISYDIYEHRPPKEQTIILNTYDTYTDDLITVKSFDSTDAGISFYVEKNGWKIYHAGDFNWWHWKDEPEENNLLARNGFKKQLKRLKGLESDIAFFPVDSRQAEFWDAGVREFCAHTKVKNLITMHNVGGKDWIMPPDFPKRDAIKSVWSPKCTGQTHIITR